MSLKIIVGYHKPCVLMNEVYFVPMHLGRALVRNRQTDQYKWMKLHTIGDDVGENISCKNQTYNEMTGLFWAWKNYSQLGNPDYIGFSHYRRFLVLNDNYKTKGGRWTVDFPSFTESPNDFMRGLGYTQKNLSTILGNFDFVASCVHCNYSVLEQYKAAEKLDYHHLSDLRLCVDIISEDSPDYMQACESYLGGNEHFYGNMFILPKDLFFRYCEFIFPVLSKFEKKVSLVDRSSYEKRFFVSERLTGIFFKKLEMEGYKCKKVPACYIENTQEKDKPRHFVSEKESVNLVFAVDQNYLSFLSVSLLSLIAHISPNKLYNVYILHENIPTDLQSEFGKNFNSIKNLNIQFINITLYLENIKTDLYIEIHVTRSTYYRFFVQEIFKDFHRVLYLDTDLIFCEDIAELYFSSLGDKALGVVPDARECLAAKLNLSISNGINWREYLKNVLLMPDFHAYFQAGVIIFDLKTMKEQGINLKDKCLSELRRIKRPILSDQDVLNSCFYGQVCYLPLEWNVEWQIPFEFSDLNKQMEESQFLGYMKAYKHPKILHYASSVKPWNSPLHGKAEIWWSYARKSPYYERMLWNLCSANLNKQSASRSCFRQWVDKVLPLGTKRRHVVARLYHFIFG